MVVETGPDGRQALGPLLPGAPSPCLDCLLQRRRASERALGTWRLMPLDATQFERLGDARLWGRRLSPEGVAERLLCCRPWGQSCPLDGYLGAALLPDDSDRSARRIRDIIAARLGVKVGVVVSDTFG